MTLFGGIITIILLFKRDKHTQKQIDLTRNQINIQDNTRKDQQFLDAIKLIEENPEKPKLGGLSILENLANTDENYRQRILEYLSTHTIKLKPIVEKNLKLNFKERFFLPNIEHYLYSINEQEEDFRKYGIEYGSVDYSGTTNEFKFEVFFKELKILFKVNDIRKYKLGEEFDKIVINNEEFNFKREFNYKDINIQIYLNPNIENNPFNEEENFQEIEFRFRLNNHQLKLSFKEFIREHNFFNFECLKLVQKILNFETKNYLYLNFQEVYFPFIYIDNSNKLMIKTKELFHDDNLIGLWIGSSSKENKENLIINLNHISKFSTVHNTKKNFKLNKLNKYNPNNLLFSDVYNFWINSSNLLLDEVFNNSLFEFSNLYFRNDSYNWFESCNFKSNCVFKSKKSYLISKLHFKNCNIYDVMKFEDIKVKSLIFENCKYYKMPLDLSNITIINKDKAEVKFMKNQFKLIEKELEKNFKWPKFENDFGLLDQK